MVYKIGDRVMDAAAPERKPWDVLREAADIVAAKHLLNTADNLRITAKRLEEEANVPDPIEVLRRYHSLMVNYHGSLDNMDKDGWSYPIWRDAKRVLAAHDKQKKED